MSVRTTSIPQAQNRSVNRSQSNLPAVVPAKKNTKPNKNENKLYDKQYISREQFLKQKKQIDHLFRTLNTYEIVKEEQSEETASQLSTDRGHTLRSKQMFSPEPRRSFLLREQAKDQSNVDSNQNLLANYSNDEEFRLPRIDSVRDQREVTVFEDEFSDILSEIHDSKEYELPPKIMQLDEYK